jgi:hypothetical protein
MVEAVAAEGAAFVMSWILPRQTVVCLPDDAAYPCLYLVTQNFQATQGYSETVP